MHSKAEILTQFQTKWEEVSSIIRQTSDDQFISKPDSDTWSIAEEFDHVIKSASAVSSALKVSPFVLKWKFGKPNRPLRTYDEIHLKYSNAIASVNGKAIAPSPFRSESGKLFDKKEMLSHWESTLKKFQQRVNKWSDKSLNNVLLPHPLLGKMMVREMLFFTQIHTEHHRKSLYKKANSE